MPNSIPTPSPQVSLGALRDMLRERNPLAAIGAFHRGHGDIFQINLPTFKPIVMIGPTANRFVLVESKDSLLWRPEGDPVAQLLRHGILVEDGERHDELRRLMSPALHKKRLGAYVETMVARTDQICDTWVEGQPLDMLVEMRKVALLILLDTLFNMDFTPELERLWKPVLRLLQFISPGIWILWKNAPRPGYAAPRKLMDEYLYGVIRERRTMQTDIDDLLGILLNANMDDDLIRDQLLTMIVAGHDTCTTLLAWALYILGKHPEIVQGIQYEVDSVLGDTPPNADNIEHLTYVGQVIDETLRLFPPLPMGMRSVAQDTEFNGCPVPHGKRVMYSMYHTHRDEKLWPDPLKFDPERFAPGQSHDYYHYIPFGGGKRMCIGAAYALVETKVVLARLFQKFEFTLIKDRVHAHLAVTMEPRPGVMMAVRKRSNYG